MKKIKYMYAFTGTEMGEKRMVNNTVETGKSTAIEKLTATAKDSETPDGRKKIITNVLEQLAELQAQDSDANVSKIARLKGLILNQFDIDRNDPRINPVIIESVPGLAVVLLNNMETRNGKNDQAKYMLKELLSIVNRKSVGAPKTDKADSAFLKNAAILYSQAMTQGTGSTHTQKQAPPNNNITAKTPQPTAAERAKEASALATRESYRKFLDDFDKFIEKYKMGDPINTARNIFQASVTSTQYNPKHPYEHMERDAKSLYLAVRNAVVNNPKALRELNNMTLPKSNVVQSAVAEAKKVVTPGPSAVAAAALRPPNDPTKNGPAAAAGRSTETTPTNVGLNLTNVTGPIPNTIRVGDLKFESGKTDLTSAQIQYIEAKLATNPKIIAADENPDVKANKKVQDVYVDLVELGDLGNIFTNSLDADNKKIDPSKYGLKIKVSTGQKRSFNAIYRLKT
jgi:hypothetical protein